MARADQWKTETLPSILERHCAAYIYNADEFESLYRATSDGSLCFKSEIFGGAKKAMYRISVLTCINMAGTNRGEYFYTDGAELGQDQCCFL